MGNVSAECAITTNENPYTHLHTHQNPDIETREAHMFKHYSTNYDITKSIWSSQCQPKVNK